ncbi:LOW QUALITY PROTEIN: centrosomal protein 20 [Choristoneura fumiferana]|uniref:LOW QUALITY PROTEIN: centrosomal protein 20 n=1 Tax=Choristoneura fumiferana TaxID=7141 RepID=UPI003D15AE6A
MNVTKETSERELLDAIKKLLKKSGHLDKIQAETRAKVTELLKERQEGGAGARGAEGPPPPAPEVLLVNELIREYLEWNGYLYTAAVLSSEAGLGGARRARGELCAAVGVRDDERSLALPLLANVVAAYVERIRRKLSRSKRDT